MPRMILHHISTRLILVIVLLCAVCSGALAQKAAERQNPSNRNVQRTRQSNNPPKPTHANLSYGPHERNILDLWLAEASAPTPLVLFIHGGGFRGGSKDFINVQDLQELLSAGISVAAIEYRLLDNAYLPAAQHDCRYALQFLRSKAEMWNIDKRRVGVMGGSAGAIICMWLAFHDEMSEPNSTDPIKRESTRVTCVATVGGQVTMDLDWWVKWIPGYDKHHRPISEYYGPLTQKEIDELTRELSALSLISSDDPPIFMRYSQKPDDPIPEDPRIAGGWKIHHVIFGVKLKEKMDALGVESHLKYPGNIIAYKWEQDFLIERLTGKRRR